MDSSPPETSTNLSPEIRKIVDEATAGLVAKRDQLLAELKQLTENMRNWDGLDHEQVKSLIKTMTEDDEVKLFISGNKETVINRHTEPLRQHYETQLSESQTKISALGQELASARTQQEQLRITHAIREAARKSGVQESAIEDVLLRAQTMFTLNEQGNPILNQLHNTTQEQPTPITPEQWLGEMKNKATHWWPPSTGGGAAGSFPSTRPSPDAVASMSQTDYESARRGGRI